MDANKIKQLKEIAGRFMGFGKEKPAPTKTPGNFEAFKIKGSEQVLEYNPALEVGSDVNESGGNGSTPAKDGEYELESGVKFTVKDGKLEAVISDGKTEPTEEEKKALLDKANETNVFTPEQMAAVLIVLENFANLQTEVAGLRTEVATYKEAFSKIPTTEVIQKFNTDVQSFGEILTELATIPFETKETKEEGLTQEQQANAAYANVANKFGAQN